MAYQCAHIRLDIAVGVMKRAQIINIILTPSVSTSKHCGAKNAIANGFEGIVTVGLKVGCGEGNGLGLGDGTPVGRVSLAPNALLPELLRGGVAGGTPMPSPNTLNTDPSLFRTLRTRRAGTNCRKIRQLWMHGICVMLYIA